MKFSTTLVATFASLSVAAPAHKRQVDDTTSTSASTDAITDVLPGITGEEPIEDTTTSSASIVDSATADALAAADPYDIYRVPAVPPTFPLEQEQEQNDFTGIQGVQDDSDDIVDAAISNLSGTSTSSDAAVPIPLTTGTPTTVDADDAEAFSALDFAGEDDGGDDTDIDDLEVDIPPIPLSTGTATATTSLDEDEVLTVDDVVVSDAQAQEMIDAAIRYAQQLPDPAVPVPMSTGTPEVLVDPYLVGNATVFGNSSASASADAVDMDSEDGTAAATTGATTAADGTDLVASLQALNDALASYQDLMDASSSSSSPSTTATDASSSSSPSTDTDTDASSSSSPSTTTDTDALTDTDASSSPSTTTTADSSVDSSVNSSADATKRKIKMLGDDMLSGIQQMQKRAEMAEQENRKMKKVLRQRGMAGGMFANKTESVATSKTVMDKMGKGVLERYVNMVAGGN